VQLSLLVRLKPIVVPSAVSATATITARRTTLAEFELAPETGKTRF
jgi:hypothetical protein